jgi:hypothetical protein
MPRWSWAPFYCALASLDRSNVSATTSFTHASISRPKGPFEPVTRARAAEGDKERTFRLWRRSGRVRPSPLPLSRRERREGTRTCIQLDDKCFMGLVVQGHGPERYPKGRRSRASPLLQVGAAPRVLPCGIDRPTEAAVHGGCVWVFAEGICRPCSTIHRGQGPLLPVGCAGTGVGGRPWFDGTRLGRKQAMRAYQRM